MRRLFTLIEDRAGPFCLALLMLVLAVQVAGRALGWGAHLTWTDEVARTLFVWSVFLSLPLASKRGAMIRIQMPDRLWPAGLRRFRPRLAARLWGLTCLGLAGLTLWNILAHRAFPLPTPILGLNQNHLMLAAPIAFLMVFLRDCVLGPETGAAPGAEAETE